MRGWMFVVLAACGRYDFDLVSDARSADAAGGDLVLWLPFDGTLLDASGNGHDGTCVGDRCPMVGVAGARGTALGFDGTADIVYVPYSTDFELPVFTVALWSRHDSQTTTAQFQTLIGRQYGALDNDVFVYGYNLNAPHDYLISLSTDVTLDDQPIIGGGDSNADLGTWTHVAITYDGTTMRMYRNGVVRVMQIVGGEPRSAATPITIGGSDNGGPVASEFCPGAIDDVRIYRRVLDADELLALATR